MHALTLGTFVLVVFAVATTRTMLRAYLFNPLTCFVGVWFLTFTLYEFEAILQIFLVDPEMRESSLILLGLASFVTGATAAALPAKGIRPRPLVLDEGTLLRLSRLTLLLLLPIFALGVAWKYAIVASVHGGILQSLPQIRDDASLGLLSFPLLSRAMTLFGYVIILNLAMLLVFRPRRVLVFICAGTVLLSLVNDMTVAARGSTVNSVLLLVCGILTATAVRLHQIKTRHLLVGVSLFALGLVLLTSMLYLRSDRTISFFERLTLDGYVYLVGNVPAMTYFFQNPWPASLPLQWTFAGLYQLGETLVAPLGIQILSRDVFVTQYAPISWIGPFNSSAFLTYFYSDLGEIGVILLSFLMGFICTYRFLVAIIRRRIVDIQTATLLMSLVIFSIKGLMTNGVMFWVTLVLLTVQHHALYNVFRARQRAPKS